MLDVAAQLIHDMRNALSVIRAASVQLHESGETIPPAMRTQLSEMVARRSEMLGRLLEDLATLHEVDRGTLALRLQPVSLADLCDELLSERMPSIGSTITLEIAEDTCVLADPLRLRQILDNLLTNAKRYGGPRITVSAQPAGSSVRLAVSDDGAGVPAALVPTLFEAYSRGPDSAGVGGNGLGLAIVRELCQAMGGAIEYDTTSGPAFVATFPAVPMVATALGADAALEGHSVSFWNDEETLADLTARYVAQGLAKGEAVLVAATSPHHELTAGRLTELGVDVAAVTASGQYRLLDAHLLHHDLRDGSHIDRDRFCAVIGGVVEETSRRWETFRVFGEIVDLYWRAGDGHLALELEACWNQLRERIPFPLLCGYELRAGESAGPVCDCHDAIVAA